MPRDYVILKENGRIVSRHQRIVTARKKMRVIAKPNKVYRIEWNEASRQDNPMLLRKYSVYKTDEKGHLHHYITIA